MKVCQRCKIEKDESEFHKHNKNKDGLQDWCKSCKAEIKHEYIRRPEVRKRSEELALIRSYKRGVKPMSENRKCTSFLGVYVAERLLINIFKNVTKMPYGNPGYDFICGKGYKIDVKSSVMHYQKGMKFPIWTFSIHNNVVADYFLCIAFDNRIDLNPIHIWLIQGKDVSTKQTVGITENPKSIKRWSVYEKPIELTKAIECCNMLKGED